MRRRNRQGANSANCPGPTDCIFPRRRARRKNVASVLSEHCKIGAVRQRLKHPTSVTAVGSGKERQSSSNRSSAASPNGAVCGGPVQVRRKRSPKNVLRFFTRSNL